MGRPRLISTERLIETARRLFLERGSAMPTSAIADELGISESTIYKRFGTKEHLFAAAMGMPACDFAVAWPSWAGRDTPRENLAAMGRALVAYFRDLLPRVVMACSRPGAEPWRALKATENPPPVVLLGAVEGYLLAEMALGRVAQCDAQTAGRMLVSAVHNFAFFESIGLAPMVERDADALIGSITETLWKGLAPR
jgi:AcrR family transcriptional regulator